MLVSDTAESRLAFVLPPDPAGLFLYELGGAMTEGAGDEKADIRRLEGSGTSISLERYATGG